MIPLKFVPNGPINNIPALVPIMAWRRPGDKPLSEPRMASLLTHICVTRPQLVNDCVWHFCKLMNAIQSLLIYFQNIIVVSSISVALISIIISYRLLLFITTITFVSLLSKIRLIHKQCQLLYVICLYKHNLVIRISQGICFINSNLFAHKTHHTQTQIS